ncbi:hypothetical protein TNCV_1185131 [Trichonephila clavipes]|nr:hypothetical protein TNCV_1185131 [Trichonephila clavipes]
MPAMVGYLNHWATAALYGLDEAHLSENAKNALKAASATNTCGRGSRVGNQFQAESLMHLNPMGKLAFLTRNRPFPSISRVPSPISHFLPLVTSQDSSPRLTRKIFLINRKISIRKPTLQHFLSYRAEDRCVIQEPDENVNVMLKREKSRY